MANHELESRVRQVRNREIRKIIYRSEEIDQSEIDPRLNSEIERDPLSDSSTLGSFSEVNSSPVFSRRPKRIQTPESNKKRGEAVTLQHQAQRDEYLKILGDSEDNQRERLQSLYAQEGSRVKLVEKLRKIGIRISKETLKIWVEELGVSNPERKKTGARINQENRDFVHEASKEGHLWLLDEWYRKVLQGRYLFEEGSKPMTLLDLREVAGVSTKQGVLIIEQDAMRILRRLKSGESVREIDKKLAKRLLNNPDSLKVLYEDMGFNTKKIASKLGYSRDAVLRSMKKLGISLRHGPRGGYAKKVVDGVKIVHMFSLEKKPIWKIAQSQGVTESIVSNTLREQGIAITRGRPRKNK